MPSPTLDFSTLDALRARHPAWRLLHSDHAPLVAGFLHRVFIAPNVRVMAAADLAEALEDELYALRQQLGEAPFVAGVGFVHNEDGRASRRRNLSVEEYRARKEAHP